MINVIAWVIAIAAWLVIVLAPVALVGLAVVPSWRRWWLRPLLRQVTGRRPELVAERIGELEREMNGPAILSFGTLSANDVALLRGQLLSAVSSRRGPVVLPPDTN